MKNIIGILAIVYFISGCDSNVLLEKIGLKEKITQVIQIRQAKAYIPNSDEPFTGKYVINYPDGLKKSETTYKEGRENGSSTVWYENGQKERETNFMDGNEDGLAVGWYENGQKESETNYKEGKRFGLTTVWDEKGQKEKGNKLQGWQGKWISYPMVCKWEERE